MLIQNGNVFTQHDGFVKKDLAVRGEQLSFDTGGETEVLDAAGKYVIPGLIDIHIHGCAGVDTCDGERASIEKMSAYLAKNGVTSFCPTSMTLSKERLAQTFSVVNACRDGRSGGAVVQGINMEGPYFSMEKRGAQNPKYIRDPDIEEFLDLHESNGNVVKIVDLAPELPGSMEFIRQASRYVTVSIAHTQADYETAREAIENGASHCTHLYNAMPSFSHREPGVIGAVYESDRVRAELICDGIHIHPAVIRSTFRTLTDDRVCLISDAMSATGMPNGSYDLGGQKVVVEDRCARLENGVLAGSASNLFDCMRNAVAFGIPLHSAVKAATVNPAKEIGIYETTGSLGEGKYADFLILDEHLGLEKVFIRGVEIACR